MTTVLLLERAAELERQRCVGLILAEVGRQILAGRRDIAAALDAVATRVEHDGVPSSRRVA